MNEHISVLLHESVDALNIQSSSIIIDGTFGRGGHSQLILDQLGPEGRLIAIDKDLAAIEHAKTMADPRFEMVHASFADIREVCAERDVLGKVDGVLLDLGVSSPQLDEAERGFSFMKDGPLDMRMDQSSGESCSEFLQHIDETELANIIYRYGDEKFSRRIAKAIVQAREEGPIESTLALAGIVEKATPRRDKHKHPATRTFQALRIHLNRELADLETFLVDIEDVLSPTGRLSIISFHSLEDRIVKQFFNDKTRGPDIPRGMPVIDEFKPGWKKVINKHKAADTEADQNIRARSAILRVGEKQTI